MVRLQVPTEHSIMELNTEWSWLYKEAGRIEWAKIIPGKLKSLGYTPT